MIRCQCGRDVELPTMRQLREYPPVERSPGCAPPVWSATRGVVFNLGLVVSLFSLAALFVFSRQRWDLDMAKPELPDSELFDLEVSRWSVDLAWKYWSLAKTTDLNYRQTPAYQAARQLADRLAILLIVAAIGLAAGVVAMAGALLGRRRLPQRA